MKAENPRIIIVDNQAMQFMPVFTRLEFEGINCNVKNFYSAIQAVRGGNPLDYQILIIDASCDINLRNYNNQSFSEWIKSQNPEIIVIGTSVQRELLTDKIANQVYDETLEFEVHEKFCDSFKRILIKYGFIQQEALLQ
ncbi:MAG: hypothetical protein AABW91_01275 [Nanoarchaeota archaeon]